MKLGGNIEWILARLFAAIRGAMQKAVHPSQTRSPRKLRREDMRQFEAVDALPPSLALLKETIERIAAFTNVKLDRLELESNVLRVRRGAHSDNVRLEAKGYRTYCVDAGDMYDTLVPNTSGMAALAATGHRFLTPEEQIARESKERQMALEQAANRPLLHGVAALLEYNITHRTPIDVHETFAGRSADEVDDAVRRFKLMCDRAAAVASARRRSRHHDPGLQEFERAHPGFTKTTYYRVVLWHEWRLMQAEDKRAPDV